MIEKEIILNKKKFDKRLPSSICVIYLLIVACTKYQLLRFILNNHNSFVDSSLHLVFCGNGVYVKLRKIRFPVKHC